MNKLARIESLHPDLLNDFLENGESSAIPVEIQNFIHQISFASEIYNYERNINRAARKLKHRILTQQGIRLTDRTCKERINDALNFFSVDSNVSSAVWDNHTADRLLDLSKAAALKFDFKTAGVLEERANFYRQRASAESQTTGTKTINFLISKNLKASDLGFVDKSKKMIAKKANDDFYIKLIKGLPAEKQDKKSLFADAEVIDYEEETADE